MIRCLLMKKKLYEYLDGGLTLTERLKVETHVAACSKCRTRLQELKNILAQVAQQPVLQPHADFWHNFKIDLDRKLNARLTPEFSFERRLRYQLRPAAAYASILIFVLIIGLYFLKGPSLFQPWAKDDESLIEEALALDEAGEELVAPQDDENAYVDEINLFYELGQDLT